MSNFSENVAHRNQAMKIFFLYIRTCLFNRVLFQLIFECLFFIDHFLRVKINILLNSITREISFFCSKYCISASADGSRHNKMSRDPLQETISKADTVQSQL